MTLSVALLRAVNLPRYGKVSMADLRAFLEGLGFDRVQTVLQSGNAVFDAGSKSGTALEKLLEEEAASKLDLHTEFFVRNASEMDAIVRGNPFPDEAKSDPGHLVVCFLRNAVHAAAVDGLQASIRGREQVRGSGRQVYIYYPDGIGRSKLTNTLTDGKLRTKGTGRNWNTVLKLAKLASS